VSRRSDRKGDLPLFAWGEDLRRRKAARERLHRRIVLTWCLVIMVTLSAVLPIAPLLVWNASASAPIGLYAVSLGAQPKRGAMVIASVPATVRDLAAARHYIPAHVPLVKHVGAVPGDTVCAAGTRVTINGKAVATRLVLDGAGRVLPWWSGCHLLREGEIFLLSADAPVSFDGRYFGISSSDEVIGTARPLWTR